VVTSTEPLGAISTGRGDFVRESNGPRTPPGMVTIKFRTATQLSDWVHGGERHYSRLARGTTPVKKIPQIHAKRDVNRSGERAGPWRTMNPQRTGVVAHGAQKGATRVRDISSSSNADRNALHGPGNLKRKKRREGNGLAPGNVKKLRLYAMQKAHGGPGKLPPKGDATL